MVDVIAIIDHRGKTEKAVFYQFKSDCPCLNFIVQIDLLNKTVTQETHFRKNRTWVTAQVISERKFMFALKIITTVLLLMSILVFIIFLIDTRKDKDYLKCFIVFSLMIVSMSLSIFFIWR